MCNKNNSPSPILLYIVSIVYMPISLKCYELRQERQVQAKNLNKKLLNSQIEGLIPKKVIIPRMERDNGSFPVYIGSKKMSIAYINKNEKYSMIEAIYYQDDNHSLLDISSRIIVSGGRNDLTLLIKFLCDQVNKYEDEDILIDQN